MSADPVRTEEQDEHLQEMIRLVHALDTHAPAELAKLLTSHGLGDDARRAVEAVAALQIVEKPHLATELVQLLAFGHGGAEAHSPDIVFGNMVAQVKRA